MSTLPVQPARTLQVQPVRPAVHVQVQPLRIGECNQHMFACVRAPCSNQVLRLNPAGRVPFSAMGGKRAVGGGNTTTPAKKVRPGVSASPAASASVERPSSLAWVDEVMCKFDKDMEICGDPLKWCDETVPNLLAHAQALDHCFPPIDGADYIKDFDHGTKLVRLWQMGFTVHYGNKGMVPLDTLRNLVELILVNGFKSNTLQPGVEALVICQPNPVFWQGSLELTPLHADMLPIASVAFVKGWTRSLAAHIVATLLIRMEIVDTVKDTHPVLFSSLCGIYANVCPFSSEVERIDANRGAGLTFRLCLPCFLHHTSKRAPCVDMSCVAADITLTSVMTRSKPNAFNHLHQLQRKLAIGESLDKMMQQWQNPKTARAVYGMGSYEAAAVLNLFKSIPADTVNYMRLVAAKYGMIKGPLTHGAIGCKAICVGYSPDTSSPVWKSMMINTDVMVDMLVHRLVDNWADVPPGLRRSVTPDGVVAMQKVVAAFHIAVQVFKTLVPPDVFDNELPKLKESFQSGSMDTQLAATAEANPWPWDLTDILEFKTILTRLQTDLETKQLQRNKELRDQVQQATFTQLQEELSDDTAKLIQYYDRLAQVRLHWGDTVTTYKRNRYNRGLESVRQLLSNNLALVVSDPAGMPMEYASFKKCIQDRHANLKDTCPLRLEASSAWHCKPLVLLLLIQMRAHSSQVHVVRHGLLGSAGRVGHGGPDQSGC